MMPAGEISSTVPGDLIDGGGEVSIGHFDDRFSSLFDPVEDLLVFDFEFGISLSFFTDDLAIGVVLT